MVSGAESDGPLRILSSRAPERRPACAADATTINRQGSDVGSQFRSAIFYDPSDLEDKETCMEAMWEDCTRPAAAGAIQHHFVSHTWLERSIVLQRQRATGANDP